MYIYAYNHNFQQTYIFTPIYVGILKPDYKVNKSMFVRLVRNIFSVVAGTSVRKKCQVREVAQRQPLLIVGYLADTSQQSQTMGKGQCDLHCIVLYCIVLYLRSMSPH